jgi:hypothetical protein
MEPIEIVVVVRTESGNNYFSVPVERYNKVAELVQIKSKL